MVQVQMVGTGFLLPACIPRISTRDYYKPKNNKYEVDQPASTPFPPGQIYRMGVGMGFIYF